MKIKSIKYLHSIHPNGSGGTGYSEPDIFEVEDTDGTLYRISIDTWYRTADFIPKIFCETMQEKFGNSIDNIWEAYQMFVDECTQHSLTPYTEMQLLDAVEAS